jgi:hypothetical protein
MEEKPFCARHAHGAGRPGYESAKIADALGVSKSTVARNEILELAMLADTLTAVMRLFRERGVNVDLLGATDSLTITATAKDLKALEERRMEKGRDKSMGSKNAESVRGHVRPCSEYDTKYTYLLSKYEVKKRIDGVLEKL